MIERISIANVATFHPTTSEELNDLRQINYIFGSNGTGKTTISRVVADPAFSVACQCTWKDGNPLETLVLNRDFVEKNFDQIKGVFTLGERQKDTEEKINALKTQCDRENQRLSSLRNVLGGDDGNGGKKGDLAKLESDYRDKFWVPIEKLKKEKKLEGALRGVLNDKEKCKQKVLHESEHNAAGPKPLSDLEKRAETILAETPTKQPSLPVIDGSPLIFHESNPILKKKVIGKDDVDIAAMITKLGNSDWVRQGLPYYEQNNRMCPFCQQSTTEQFAQSLRDYFDEAFENDTMAINTLISQYANDETAMQSDLEGIIAEPGKFIDVERMKAEKAALDQTLAANKLRLEGKKKEPSQLVSLDSVNSMIISIKAMIEAANAEVAKHNSMVDNLAAERATLTAEVWRYVLNELELDLKQYRQNKDAVEKAIAGLNGNITETETRIKELDRQIRELEKQATSIQPTINAINATLKQFGFDSFTLADAGDAKHYKLIRANGEDAKRTLSEGEKTFVVFLYFYHLLKGSFSESGTATDRVVVFDDPVSSLDSDVLFIVSSLIKEICETVRGGSGYVKQVLVLTHNVYFHKQVTYDRKRASDVCRSDETFWIVRKRGSMSSIERCKNNPIKSSYDLLWHEVRLASSGQNVDPNVLRRILEHYYTILGSFDDLNKVINEITGRDKIIASDLLSFLHAGSHSVFDDAHMNPSSTTPESYLRVFKKVFDDTNHGAHYQMMIGPTPVAVAPTASP